MADNKKSITDIITECLIDKNLDSVLLKDAEYIKMQNRINEKAVLVDGLKLDREEKLMIDRLICAYTESSAYYGKIAYKQGFMDCMAFMREVDLMKAS